MRQSVIWCITLSIGCATPALSQGGPAGSTVSGPDTLQPRPRPRAVTGSDWYNRRFTIHKYGAYAVMPVFGAQFLAGRQLYDKSRSAPGWAKTTHRAGATTLAVLFTSNTVTGLWNLWDSRSVENNRTLRYVHAFSMLAADAGFTYAGARLSDQAENDLNKRKQHRTLALSSMGITAASGLMMRIWNK